MKYKIPKLSEAILAFAGAGVTVDMLLNDGKALFLVYGHNMNGKGKIVEIEAYNGAEALDVAKKKYPDCRFNHVNLK